MKTILGRPVCWPALFIDMTLNIRTLTADRGDAGRRLDLVLRRHLTDVDSASRTRVQSWIEGGCVTVNGTAVRRVSTRAMFGDVMAITLPDEAPAAAMIGEDLALDVVYEDESLLAVNKPAGMVVHPTYKHARGTPGRRMQGVGPCQLTWWTFQDRADELGGCFKPGPNIRTGVERLGVLIKERGSMHGALVGYRLTGEKLYTTNAPRRDNEFLASLLVVIAQIVQEPREIARPKSERRFGAFVVDTHTPGCRCTRLHYMGVRGIYNGAVQLGIQDRVGSIELGKDADVVIWSGDPLSVYSTAETTFIDGEIFFDKQRDLAMRDQMAKERAALEAADRGRRAIVP